MPFHVRDPWRVQYFEQVPCPDHVSIPIDDIDCWDWFPDCRPIYDKLHVAESQKVACGTMENLPPGFPVFAKPRINLKGMGLGSRLLHTELDFRTFMTPEMMWMEVFKGPHVSTDCAVVKGNVAWIRHATGIVWTEGMFKHWIVHAETERELARYLAEWVRQELPGYTGMVNLETIGGRIIEAQIRFADQWCDLYGRPWLDAVVRLYEQGLWTLVDEARRVGYSIPLFARHGHMPKHPSESAQAAILAMSDVSSLQITFHENRPAEDHPMPPGGFRLGLVNGWDLAAGLAARRELAKAFDGVDVLLPD
jgi:hypothetical protein